MNKLYFYYFSCGEFCMAEYEILKETTFFYEFNNGTEKKLVRKVDVDCGKLVDWGTIKNRKYYITTTNQYREIKNLFEDYITRLNRIEIERHIKTLDELGSMFISLCRYFCDKPY